MSFYWENKTTIRFATPGTLERIVQSIPSINLEEPPFDKFATKAF